MVSASLQRLGTYNSETMEMILKPSSESHSSAHQYSRFPLLAVTLALLTACSGDSGSGTQNSGPQEITSTPAQLQERAAKSAGGNVTANIGTILNMASGSTALSAMLEAPGINTILSDDDGAGSVDGLLNDAADDALQSDFENLLDATLGLSGSATSRQSGSRIIIDPDESELCRLWSEDTASTTELDNCSNWLGNVLVYLDAETDESGTLTYLYNTDPVVVIDYAPASVAYELKLGALRNFMVGFDSTQTDNLPEIMQGALRLSSAVTSEELGSESGSMSISVTEALRIADPAGTTDLSIAPSTLFALEADQATGTASLEVNMGAIDIAMENDDDSSSISRLVMAGLTARLQMNNNGDSLTLSNVGIGNGPMTISIDSVEAVRMALSTFGFTVDGSTGDLTLSNEMALSFTANNISGMLDKTRAPDYSTNISVSAPASTTFSGQQNESIKVSNNGPLTISYSFGDSSATVNGNLIVQSDQCFAENDADDMLATVSCE